MEENQGVTSLEMTMFFKRNFVSLIVVFGLGVAFASWTDKTESTPWITAGMVAIAAYFAASLALRTIKGISAAIYIWLLFQKDMTASILGGMRGMKIPPPKRHDEKSMAYFLELANDGTAEIPDRVKAASFFAAYEATRITMGFLEARAYAKAANAAVNHYYLEQGSARS